MSPRVIHNPPLPGRFPFFTARDFDNFPPQKWAVKNLLPAQGLAGLYGPSSSGKSYLGADLTYALVNGEPWFNHATTKCKVLYLVQEGQTGFVRRVQALQQHNGQKLPKEAAFLLERFQLNNDDDVDDLIRAIKAAGGFDVLIIDTLNRVAPNVDENSSQQMGILLAAASKLQKAIGGLILIIHHTGKDHSRGMRGHSSLFAAMDAVIEVSYSNSVRQWKLVKAKDAEDGISSTFELLPVELKSKNGEVIKSCVVKSSALSALAKQVSGQPKGSNQKLVLKALLEELRNSTEHGQGGAPVDAPCLGFERACRAIQSQLPIDPKRQYERTKVSILQLVRNGLIVSGEGWLWAP